MRKLFTLFILMLGALAGMAGNTITYTASEQLTETTSSSGSGLHTNAFYNGETQLSITSHTFSDGTGTITFSGEVTAIDYSAFRDCSGLTSIDIPNSVTTIGNWAFYNCTGLTSITIPESITSIGEYAFMGCTGLTSITIPNSVTSIGKSAFGGCTGLTSVTIPNSVTSIGANAFNMVKNIIYNGSASGSPWGALAVNGYLEGNLIYSDASKVSLLACLADATGIVTIPNSVTSIGGYAFYECSGLTSIDIPNSVTTIGNWAFYGCSGLTSVTIGNSVESIGHGAFYGCSGLTSVTIPNSVTSIGNRAFYECSGLTYVVIPNSVISIGKGAFQYCSGLTSVTLPNSVNSIDTEVFNGCTSLASIIIPNSVTSIGENAFNGCSGLTSVSIGNSVTEIGSSAFEGCTGVSEVYCYAQVPPVCNATPFSEVITSEAKLYVMEGSLEAYHEANVWSDFQFILPIGATSTETTEDTVTASAGSNDVVLTWPVEEEATSYLLQITQEDTFFCTLTFNSTGQLIGYAAAPRRDSNYSHAPAATVGVEGMSFTVTGLDFNTRYAYTVEARKTNGQSIKTYEGSFTTNAPTALEDLDATVKSQKLMRDGILYIRRGEHLYDSTGRLVE